MTRFSPPMIYQCPACAGYFKRSTLAFLHFYDDAPEWSDGLSDQWRAGAGAPVGCCPTCHNVSWIDDTNVAMPTPQTPSKISPVARLWHRMTRDKRGRLRDEQRWAAVLAEIKHADIHSLNSSDDLLEALAGLPADDVDASRGESAPNGSTRYTLPDHKRNLRGRLLQAIVDRLHRDGD